MADQKQAPAFTAEDIEKAKTEARNAALAEAKAEATAGANAAAKAAQERVAAILGHEEAKGRTKAAQHIAFKTAMSVEDAIAMLASTEKEAATAANALADAMARVPNPKIGADAGNPDNEAPQAPVAANVYAMRRQCVVNARAGK